MPDRKIVASLPTYRMCMSLPCVNSLEINDTSKWPLGYIPFTSGFLGSGPSFNHTDSSNLSGTFLGAGFIMEDGDCVMFRGERLMHCSTRPYGRPEFGRRLVVSLWIDKSVLNDMTDHKKDPHEIVLPRSKDKSCKCSRNRHKRL
eukprot:scaffold50789_cov21-Prasinocladus_malaysianus.AAC.1